MSWDAEPGVTAPEVAAGPPGALGEAGNPISTALPPPQPGAQCQPLFDGVPGLEFRLEGDEEMIPLPWESLVS